MSVMIRSKSLHREPAARRLPNHGISSPAMAWRQRKWRPPEKNGTAYKTRSENYDMDVSPPLRERQLMQVNQRTQTITVLMRKLKELLPPFCKAISECQFGKCCSLMASHIELSVRHKPSNYSSPIFGRGFASPVSPSRSPIRAWLSGSGLEPNDSNSSLEEAGGASIAETTNLDVFFLLTGAESMYTSLAHVNSTSFATLLVECYEKAIMDLKLLRLTLGDAFLVRDDDEEELSQSTTGPTSDSTVAAVADSLAFLVSLCKTRIQSIQLQSALWRSSPDFIDMVSLFDSLLPNLQKINPSNIVEPLHASLIQEVGAWSFLCRTAHLAQNCRFADSILAAQSTKAKILKMRSGRSGKDLSCLDWWLQDTLKNIIGIFPIIFDKTATFVSPLYGFDEDIHVIASPNVNTTTSTDDSSSFRNNTTMDAFEVEMMEALHKYEKIGAISVAVIIDAVQTSSLRPEGGFSLEDKGIVDNPSDPEATMRQRFPAVFMRTRSSMHAHPLPDPPLSVAKPPVSPTSSSPKGLLGFPKENSWKDRLNRRSFSRQNDVTPPSSPMPSSPTSRKILKSWSNDEGPSLPKKKKSLNNLEYGPEEGPGAKDISWPHSEWRTLVGFLTESGNDGASVQAEAIDGLDSRSIARGPRVSYSSNQTLYCIENVSENMWLVVMMKSSEMPTADWGWHTPIHTTESVEDELRELAANLSSMLRISGQFEVASTRLLRNKFIDRCSDEIGVDLTDEVRDRGFDEGRIDSTGVCRLIKNHLRALAQVNRSSVEAGGTSAVSAQSRLLGRRRRLRGQNRVVGHSESAAAFFLGHELMSTFFDW